MIIYPITKGVQLKMQPGISVPVAKVSSADQHMRIITVHRLCLNRLKIYLKLYLTFTESEDK